MNPSSKVVVAMSGGVDSSVAAALLVEQGYQVIGMMMRLWSEPGTEESNRCCTPDAMAQARRVAAQLGIPFYAVDAQEVFYNQVVKSFINGYAQNTTPNPCLVCNRYIRWEFLLARALSIGADYMATGHYARVIKDDQNVYRLFRAEDIQKDQSYILHVLGQDRLKHAIFPLGDLTKPQVRQIAHNFNLSVAERPESQDLCFLGNGNYRDFLHRNAPQIVQPGPIKNSQGQVIGEHQGLPFYTIGQRKGLGVTASYPLYVINKDISSNILIIGGLDELGYNQLTAFNVNWVSNQIPSTPFRAQVKIRYKAREAPATITPIGLSQVQIQFDENLRDITPGQAAVIYTGGECLGGGIIQTVR